jgi:hypothetical protein
MTPNTSLEPTRYGRHRLAAPGHRGHCPSAASRHLPPRAAQLQRYASAAGWCLVAGGLCVAPRAARRAVFERCFRSCSAPRLGQWRGAVCVACRVAAVKRGGARLACMSGRSSTRTQSALQCAVPALRRSSGARRVRTQVPVGPGSHNTSIERTCSGALRAPTHAAHVELQGLPPLSSK